ncbi:MAG: hemerythrin family protein [Halobacteriovoraceae bacterium]|jgi:hemerythrin|nr:hemerythrin family protein [Halobacteriovoraceae bacterium]MBT5093298.1 hemerythrin family protein [Halobacteriovoraceae bacterium]
MTFKFEWKEEFDIGVETMNNEHKKIIMLINELVGVIEKEGDVAGSFNKLASYVVEHFENEERFMEAKEFSGLNGHKLIHKSLLEKVGGFGDDIANGKLESHKLISFLQMWLSSHIKGIDMKYGNEINGKKAA